MFGILRDAFLEFLGIPMDSFLDSLWIPVWNPWGFLCGMPRALHIDGGPGPPINLLSVRRLEGPLGIPKRESHGSLGVQQKRGKKWGPRDP